MSDIADDAFNPHAPPVYTVWIDELPCGVLYRQARNEMLWVKDAGGWTLDHQPGAPSTAKFHIAKMCMRPLAAIELRPVRQKPKLRVVK